MTLTTIFTVCAVIAAVLTLVIGRVVKDHKSYLMTFAQNFTGVLFIFSGWVKAVDPLGTAYKMEQYFGEFEYLFEGTWFSFIAPLFPWLGNFSIGFSVFMIIFEIVLGLMLLMGMRTKLTAWLFLLLVAFFTVLTGFTFLTGYVPEGANFFEFGKWTAYNPTNMKVTDCGCFGDFIKLEPRISFYKDIFLLVPALIFVFRHKDMHQLFTKQIRWAVVSIATLGLLLYCWSNYKWDLPHTDFRPFKVGTDVAAVKEMEQAAQADVQVVAWKLKNEKTGEILEVPTKEYFDNLSGKYSKDNGWGVEEQIKTEPTMKPSKISDFDIKDYEGNDVTYEYLENENPHFMVISHKTYADVTPKKRMVTDSISVTDTIQSPTGQVEIVTSKQAIEREEQYDEYAWDPDWMGIYRDKFKPILDEASAAGYDVSIVLGGADVSTATAFATDLGVKANYYTADDILLKTIVRSNPGLVLWKDGVILDKWHERKLESYKDIVAEHLK